MSKCPNILYLEEDYLASFTGFFPPLTYLVISHDLSWHGEKERWCYCQNIIISLKAIPTLYYRKDDNYYRKEDFNYRQFKRKEGRDVIAIYYG